MCQEQKGGKQGAQAWGRRYGTRGPIRGALLFKYTPRPGFEPEKDAPYLLLRRGFYHLPLAGTGGSCGWPGGL